MTHGWTGDPPGQGKASASAGDRAATEAGAPGGDGDGEDSIPVASEALRANLARTAVAQEIPAEHRVLLEIAEPWLGVHRATELLLREIHHRYAGWPQALADLHRQATGDLHRHALHPRGPEAVRILCELYAKVAAEAAADTAADAVRLWLRYLQLVVEAAGPGGGALLAEVDASLVRLGEALERDPARTAPAAEALRRLARTLADSPDAAAAAAPLVRCLRLLCAALERVYRRWAAGVDPAAWYRAIAASPEAGLPPDIEAISCRRMQALRDRVRALAATPMPAALLLHELEGLPDHHRIQQAYLDAATAVAHAADPRRAARDRLHWLLRVLAHEELAAVQEPALREVGRCFSDLMDPAGGNGREDALREVLDLLREGSLPLTPGVQGLIGQVGRRVLASGDPQLAEALVDELLRLDFDYPDFSGFTAEWGPIVNPAHLRRIRTYLGLVEASPQLTRQLVAGLVVHLSLGGVFVADTDLFQRDVSSLLASPITPVYLEVKQLLRLVPVYFNEIGAEGALRSASTCLDEMAERRDALCHFLRKQSHVECNPRLVAFAEEVVRYWLTGDPAPLRGYVPAAVLAEVAPEAPERLALSRASAALAARAGGIDELLAAAPDHVDALAAGLDPGAAKVALLLRVRREIARKYELDHSDLVPRLRAFRRVPPARVERLARALDAGTDDDALDAVLSVLEALQAIVLGPGETQADERIFRKRHIAAGIPSMYGSYHEPRFEAMGLTFRAGALAAALFARRDAAGEPRATDGETLRTVARRLTLHLRALRVDGFRARGLEEAIGLLEEALDDPRTTARQLLNVFQLMSHRIEDMIQARILDPYGVPVGRIAERMVERGLLLRPPGATVREAAMIRSDAFLRTLVALSLGLQGLDALVGRTIRRLASAPSRPAAPAATPPARAELDDCVAPLSGPEDRRGLLALGGKGFLLRRLTQLGFRVPDGFVLTTELFRMRRAIWDDPAARAALGERLRTAVGAIEARSGTRLGDPDRPLLLSVRSGAAISMPGMLETFLNVGMTDAVVEGMARLSGRAWAAWDAYRRFLQSWGMSAGIERDVFDELIRAGKDRHGVPRKAQLAAGGMRDVALGYREVLRERGALPADDPWEQLLVCVERVQGSWESERARTYRDELHIAEEWGTAVVVQRMAFGNLGPRSGTGVLLTRHPARASHALEIYGDFAVQAQGDDVVGGLVETLPLTERQRLERGRPDVRSLERGFPRIHEALVKVARRLVEEEGMNHQEIEFTFESEWPADLYILQTRDTVVAPPRTAAAFTPGERLQLAHAASGIGVGGGALSGRVAHSAQDVDALRSADPAQPIILLRRDTVPEDIPLVLRVDGLLTSLGGATSHAAVAAKRLGKTCVVGCRALDVSERLGTSVLAGHRLATGDVISIDGLDGSVYLGRHPVATVRLGAGGRIPPQEAPT